MITNSRQEKMNIAFVFGILITTATLLHPGAVHAAQENACVPPSQAPQAPIYPEAEKKGHVGGTAMLVLTLDECGAVSNVYIETSTRNRNLDRAAITAARTWALPTSKATTVRVPVIFNAGSARPGDVAPLVAESDRPGGDSTAVTPSNAAETASSVPGYIPDDRPLGFATAKAALAFMDAPCGGAAAQRLGCHQMEIRPADPHVIMISDACDVSYWAAFPAESGIGPSVVRDRFFFRTDGITELRTSLVCDAPEAVCTQLLATLKARPPQPQPGPPPLPPPPAGIVCK